VLHPGAIVLRVHRISGRADRGRRILTGLLRVPDDNRYFVLYFLSRTRGNERIRRIAASARRRARRRRGLCECETDLLAAGRCTIGTPLAELAEQYSLIGWICRLLLLRRCRDVECTDHAQNSANAE